MSAQVRLHASHDEQLQTDVMRFMAIIAFCLMAVLALVKASPSSLTPVSVQEPVSESAAEQAIPADIPEPVVVVEPVPEQAIKPLEEVLEEPIEVSVEEVREAPIEELIEEPTETPAIEPPMSVVAPESSMADPIPAEEIIQEAEADEAGLSLRFASDKDFLRLLARGSMSLFAFERGATGTRVYELDSNYAFRSVKHPPRQVYEVMSETIPGLITSRTRLEPAGVSLAHTTWGVTFPRATEEAIVANVERHASGTLIINRYGEVRHEAP